MSNSNNSNIWYLDRGKNFLSLEGRELFEGVISIINATTNGKEISSKNLIAEFPQKFKMSGNPNALLTTIRNIGIINKKNVLGESVRFYLNNQLSYEELIFENLTKINYDKGRTQRVKPFVVICITLYKLFMIDPKEAYISRKNCIDYLFKITRYEDINKELLTKIINNRDDANSSGAVLDIWFNAFKEFEIFKGSNKNILRMNKNEIDFYEYAYKKANKIPCYLNSDENQPYDSIYDEIGSIKTGINAIIPEVVINDGITINTEAIKEIYEYLFGIKNELKQDYFIDYCFGIYKPFRTIQNIAIRKLKCPYKLKEGLFEYNNYIIK